VDKRLERDEWRCLRCGRPRPVEEWGKPCECSTPAYEFLAEQEEPDGRRP
jgi:hypothetical protein